MLNLYNVNASFRVVSVGKIIPGLSNILILYSIEYHCKDLVVPTLSSTLALDLFISLLIIVDFPTLG